MKEKEIVRRLSAIVGAQVRPKIVDLFSIPTSSFEHPLTISAGTRAVFRGYSRDSELKSRRTGLIGPGFLVTFMLHLESERILETQRGYLLDEHSRRETVRLALEGIINLGEGNYFQRIVSAENNLVLDYNII